MHFLAAAAVAAFLPMQGPDPVPLTPSQLASITGSGAPASQAVAVPTAPLDVFDADRRLPPPRLGPDVPAWFPRTPEEADAMLKMLVNLPRR